MKHIIFDLDGTLLDSMHIWKNIGSEYLIKKGFCPPDNLQTIIKSRTLPQTADYFIQELGVPYSVEEIVDTIIQMVSEQYRHHIQLKPYVMDYLKKQKSLGTRMCIVTASESSYIKAALERLQMMDYFDFVMTCTEAGYGKDSPKVFHMAMEKLDGNLENTAVFEDALYAVRTAKSGGFYVVAVQDATTEQDAPLIKQLCDRYIYSFQELL